MPVIITEKTELNRLVSPHKNLGFGIHNWHIFRHGYSRDLVYFLVNRFSLSKGDWVLDPFCGSGTTLLACKELGINSRGYDILPFSVYLSNTKIQNYDKLELNLQFEKLKKEKLRKCKNIFLPDIPIVHKAFTPEVAIKLISIKSLINKIENPDIKAFFNLGFLSILESVSNTSKSGGFLKIIDRKVDPDNVSDIFFSKIKSMIQDVVYCDSRTKDVNTKATLGDARKLPTKRRFDAIITSPPYPNRHDYTRIYSLEMIFDFVSNNDQLKKIRYDTIRSHVEARKKFQAMNYQQPALLNDLLTRVKRNGTNNPRVIDMLKGYFEDMYLSLSELYRCLNFSGNIALVVSNVRFAGINIPVDELLSEIGIQVGLTPVDIWVTKYRGNSSQQMKRYSRNPSRESIVFWRKDA
jgi:hypothetical protein